MTSSATASRPARYRFGHRLLVTVRARHALRRLVAESGPQHVLLAWPSGATTLPAAIHTPSPFEAIVGHVAGCPIYVELRRVGLFRNVRLLLDVPEEPQPNRRPILRLHSA